VLAVSYLWILLLFAGQADTAVPPDAPKLAEAELSRAEAAFDRARDAYQNGRVSEGDAALDEMNKALTSCADTLSATRKSRLYKKAELRAANLQRRLATLLGDIPLPERGWAEQMSRRLDEIHEKLLAGVMRK
jgi:hypothetical protein